MLEIVSPPRQYPRGSLVEKYVGIKYTQYSLRRRETGQAIARGLRLEGSRAEAANRTRVSTHSAGSTIMSSNIAVVL